MAGNPEFERYIAEMGCTDVSSERYLPDSYPLLPGDQKHTAKTPKSIEEEEIYFSHKALDELGVPRLRNLSVEETIGGVPSTHELRLHGRLRMLSERLASLGVENIFPFDNDSTIN